MCLSYLIEWRNLEIAVALTVLEMNKNYIIIHVDYIGNVIDFPLTMNLILSMNAQNESCLYLGSFKKTFRITVSLHNSELNSLQLQIVSLLN